MYGGPFPPVDIFSFLIPAAVILGVVYVAIALTQRRASAAASPGGNGGSGLDNPVLRILYTLAVAALVAAFVSFGIETVYPSPEYPEEEFMFAPVEAQEPTPEMREAERRFQRETEAWEREFDAHNRVASVAAIGAAVLILLGGLAPAIGRLPAIGDGVTLGGVLTPFPNDNPRRA